MGAGMKLCFQVYRKYLYYNCLWKTWSALYNLTLNSINSRISQSQADFAERFVKAAGFSLTLSGDVPSLRQDIHNDYGHGHDRH
jgi:hypothetical protein